MTVRRLAVEASLVRPTTVHHRVGQDVMDSSSQERNALEVQELLDINLTRTKPQAKVNLKCRPTCRLQLTAASGFAFLPK